MTRNRKAPLRVPFGPKGEPLYWVPSNWVPPNGYCWLDNFVFDDGLAIVGFSRGRSAANFDLLSVNDGRRYTIFLTDFLKALSLASAYKADVDGESRLVLVGVWEFVKRGQNYGVRMLGGGGPTNQPGPSQGPPS